MSCLMQSVLSIY